MRIGLITGEYPPLQGGVSAHVDVLAQYLTQHGHYTFIFSNERAKQQHTDIPVTNHIRKWGYSTIKAVQRWIAENQLDLVNLHFQTAAYDMSAWVHFMPHFIDVPFITTFHDLRFPYLFPKAGKLRDWIVMHLASASTGVIVTNHEDYQQIKHLPSAMIPIGSSIDRAENIDCDAMRSKLGVSDDDFLLAHFGFINHSKGIDTLLQALAHLENPNIKLLMIGGRTGTADPTNAIYADTIDAMIEQLNLKAQIIWTGYVTNQEVGTYLRAADLVTLPFRDGASFRRSSLMAAIEQGCAIVTTTPSVPIPEFTALIRLVEPENPQALADTIQEIQIDENLDTMRQKTEQLRQRFDWNTITQKNLDFFTRMLEQNA